MGWALGFAALNGLAILALMPRYVRFMGVPDTMLAKAYLWVAIISHPFVLTCAVALALLFPLILVWPRRWLAASAGILAGTLGLALILLDQVVYAQYRFHLNKVVLEHQL